MTNGSDRTGEPGWAPPEGTSQAKQPRHLRRSVPPSSPSVKGPDSGPGASVSAETTETTPRPPKRTPPARRDGHFRRRRDRPIMRAMAPQRGRGSWAFKVAAIAAVVVIGEWTYRGRGWKSRAERYLAASEARRAEEARRFAREAVCASRRQHE